jgi:hypothetical protein
MPIPTATELLTADEAETLAAARHALRAIRQRASELGCRTDDPSEALNAGRVAEAADVADDVVFNVVNCASSYLSCLQAVRSIDLGRPSGARNGN